MKTNATDSLIVDIEKVNQKWASSLMEGKNIITNQKFQKNEVPTPFPEKQPNEESIPQEELPPDNFGGLAEKIKLTSWKTFWFPQQRTATPVLPKGR